MCRVYSLDLSSKVPRNVDTSLREPQAEGNDSSHDGEDSPVRYPPVDERQRLGARDGTSFDSCVGVFNP